MSTTVLLVDDSQDLLEVMGLLMQHEGIDHLEAHSLSEVEELGPRLEDVTLAVLDVNLGPGEPSGVEVAAWLREHDVHCRVVFLTGHAPEHPLVQAAAGLEGTVLAKPVDSRELVRLAAEGR